MNLKKIIDINRIEILTETTKKQALLKIIELIRKTSLVKDIDSLTQKIFYREKLMSTGIGLGIAIPHIRFEDIVEPLIAIGIQPAGIPDYQSIDDHPVKIIVMILAGKNQHKEHIKILAQIVSKLKFEDTIQQIIKSKTRDNIYKLLAE